MSGQAEPVNASIARRVGSGNVGQVATIRSKSGSMGEEFAVIASDIAPLPMAPCGFLG